MLTEKRYLRYLLLAVSALLTGLTLVLPAVGFLEWLTLIGVGIFLLEMASDGSVRLRRLYGYGVFFFFCFGLVIFHWFLNLYPLEFINGMTRGAAVTVVLVAWLGLSLLQALFGGLAFVLMGMTFRSALARRVPFLRVFLGAGVWAVYEWTQTLGWWGVPWGRLPLGQTKYLVGLQTATIFGSYFVTFMLVSVNFCFAYALLAFLRRKESGCGEAVRYACLTAAILLVVQYGAGTVLWFSRPTGKSENTLTMAGVQGNIASGEKWSFSSTAKTKEVYRKYTLTAAEAGADVVVWPETALPFTIAEGNPFYDYASELAREAGVTILVGAFSEAPEEKDLNYNALICFLPDGQMHETVYAKRRLVPFGEFVPLRGLIETLIPPLADLVLSGTEIAEGKGASVLVLEEGTFGSLICFDSIYEELTRDSVRDGAQVLCLATNDSWFTDSVALDMHNAQAQLRAIESGRYVLRAANTGISSVISHRGEIVEKIEPHREGAVIGTVELRTEMTPYTVLGNAFIYLLIFLLVNVFSYDVGIKVRKKYEKNMNYA